MPADEAIAALIAEGHEDRITRLETGHQELSKGVTENSVKLEYLGRRIDENNSELRRKIDENTLHLTSRLDEVMKPIAEKVDTAVVQTATKVAKLEQIEDRRSERRKFVYKVGAPLLVAIVGWMTHYLWDVAFRMHGR